LDLNERQIKGIIHIKEKGKITNKEYRELSGIKDRLATIELNDMVDKKILKKFGTTGRGTYYSLRKAQKAQRAQ
jgi:ATP-dependent DNA helicase RecG